MTPRTALRATEAGAALFISKPVTFGNRTQEVRRISALALATQHRHAA